MKINPLHVSVLSLVLAGAVSLSSLECIYAADEGALENFKRDDDKTKEKVKVAVGSVDATPRTEMSKMEAGFGRSSEEKSKITAKEDSKFKLIKGEEGVKYFKGVVADKEMTLILNSKKKSVTTDRAVLLKTFADDMASEGIDVSKLKAIVNFPTSAFENSPELLDKLKQKYGSPVLTNDSYTWTVEGSNISKFCYDCLPIETSSKFPKRGFYNFQIVGFGQKDFGRISESVNSKEFGEKVQDQQDQYDVATSVSPMNNA